MLPFQTAKSIGDNTDRSDALASIAESQAESGEFDAAIGTSKSILVNRKDYLRHWHAVPTSAKYVSKTGVCCSNLRLFLRIFIIQFYIIHTISARVTCKC